MHDMVVLTGRFDRTGVRAFFGEQLRWQYSSDVQRGYDLAQRDDTWTLSGSAFSAFVSFVGASATWLSPQGAAWYAAHLIWCARHGGLTAPLAAVPEPSSGVTRYEGPLSY